MTDGASVRPVAIKSEPLNILVARALGCNVVSPVGLEDSCWICACSVGEAYHGRLHNPTILPYGEDSPEGWACTGPLLSRNSGISVESPRGCTGGALAWWVGYHADPNERHNPILGSIGIETRIEAGGSSAPEAVARLIVAMAQHATLHGF